MKLRAANYFNFLVCLVLMMSTACGGKNNTSDENPRTTTETGSISFRLVLADENQSGNLLSIAAINCDAEGVSTVEAAVYDESDAHQQSGGPWACSLHQGTIADVPIGTQRRVAVLCKSSDGVILLQGGRSGIAVTAGQNTNVGEIVLTRTNLTITASAGDGGSISPSGDVLVDSGADQIFTITPDANYILEDVLVDGVSQGAITEYTFPAVAENHTISATFIAYGTVKWTFDTGAIVSSPAMDSDGVLYVSSMNGYLYLLNPDGSQKAAYAMGTSMSSSPSIHSDGTIYVGGNNGNLFAVNPDGTLKWIFSTGDVIDSSPAIGSDGTIYIGSDDGVFYAVNHNGSEKWRNSMYVSYDINSSAVIGKDGVVFSGGDGLYGLYPDDGSTKWVHFEGGDPLTSVAIDDDGTLYGCFIYGNVTAVNPDGSVKWQYDVGNKYSNLEEGIYTSPVIGSDGTIYIGVLYNDTFRSTSFGELQAFNRDGTLKWSFPDDTAYATVGPIRSTPAVAADGTVYVGSDDGNIYAINPDGTELWRAATENTVRSSPVIGSDGTVYIGSSDGKTYAIIGGAPPDNGPWPMFQNNWANTGYKVPNFIEGTLKWSRQVGSDQYSHRSSPAIDDNGTVYVGSSDGNLYAILADGSLGWTFSTGDSSYSSPLIGPDGTIYIGTYTNELYAVNPDGSQKWRFTAGGRLQSSPAIADDGTIYIGCNDYNLYAVNPNGTQKWTVPTGNVVRSSPSIGTDGTIYVGSYDSLLYAVSPEGNVNWTYQHATNNGPIGVSPAIGDDGVIFFGDTNGFFHAVTSGGSQSGGGPLDMVGTILSSPAIDASHYQNYSGTLYVATNGGNLFAIDTDDWSISPPKWSLAIGATNYSSPTLSSNGTIYVGSGDNRLYAVNPNGTTRWSFATQGAVQTAPAIGDDGTVYVVSGDGNLYAIYGHYPLMISGQWPMFHKDVKHTGRK